MSGSGEVRQKSAMRRLLGAFVVFSTIGAGAIASSGTSGAAITAVTGSAYGYYANISLFGGPSHLCGAPPTTPCPNPAVALPTSGSATPVTANLTSENLSYGSAHIFDSGPISVSTQGAPGPTSTVTSSTSIAGCTTAVSNGCNAGQIYAGPFTATGVSSTCSADGSTNPAGSVTITAGQLAEEPAGGGAGGTPGPPITVPTNPAPNYTVTATNPDTGKVYKYVFNQQIVNPDGSLTVNAAQEYLNGGSSGAQGNLIFGQSVCGVTGTPTTTTVAPTTTTSVAPTTTTTVAPTTTTSVAPTTTTTVAPTTTATLAPSQVGGSAFGYYASISLFGGPASARGPTPTVSLPPGGSASPVSASVASGSVVYGPATIFLSGPIAISTQGTPAGGSVTSSSQLQGISTGGGGGVTADQVRSTCTANQSGPTGSTTITNGRLVTSTDSSGNPATSVALPTNPPPNYTVFGTVNNVGGSFKYVFNEQIVNPNGSITVNAGHEYIGGGPNNHGPAVGDLIYGQSVCARVASASASGGVALANSPSLANTTAASAASSTASGGALAATGFDANRLIWLALWLLVLGCAAVCWAGIADGRGGRTG